MFVITGGGTGIGRALAELLASMQHRVLVVGRRESVLRDVSLTSSYIEYCCADVSTEVGRQLIVEKLRDVPVIKGLIHNAGVIEPIVPVRQITLHAWQQVLSINLEAPLFLTQLLFAKLVQGRVLHIGSGAAHFPVRGWSAYCVSKAALAMLTQCWQLECQEVAFASVMPGIVDTDMQTYIRRSNNMDAEKLKFFKTLQSSGQLISPATAAIFLHWLLCKIDKAEYIAREWDIYDATLHARWLPQEHPAPILRM